MKVSQYGKFQEHWKFLQVQSQKQSSAMMKLALMKTATGMEGWMLQRIISLELSALEIAGQINASQSSSNRHISTSTVQRRLCESGLHGWIAAKKPLLENTNKKKCHLGQETRAMDIRPVEMCPLVWSPNWRFLVPTSVSLWDAVWVNGCSLHVYFPP